MDEIDVKILKCLKANARENASVISDHVGMSVSAVIAFANWKRRA